MEIAVDNEPGMVVVRETGRGQYQQEVISGLHHLLADEPENVGGLDSGPGPYELLLAALGVAALCRSQPNSSEAVTGPPPARTDLRLRLFRMRNEGGDD
jgi:hypothetical protein